MASSNDSPVLEGFICPICKSDRGTAENLLSHFQDEHSEEQDLIKTFRDLLDKAKKKILKQDTFSTSSNDSPKYSSSSFEFVYEPQELGVINSHTQLFMRVREDRLQRLAVPTNQLIIRLEKLLVNMPSDPQKRKVHEQNIVPWIDGTAVPRCPNCAGSFHLARRQHHCRLCGSVMCNDCSHFMDISTAMRILDRPVKEETTSDKGPTVEPQQLRLCIHCIGLLEVREEKRMSLKSKPIIRQFYERLAEYRSQAEKLNAEYRKMANSLNSGESTYSLKEAQVVKVRLLRLSENIDSLSSKIAVLGIDSDNPPQGQALRLQNMIRSACTMYLREQALSLPNLPNEEELERIQHRRREKITAKIQEEKMRRNAKMNHSNTQKPSTSPNKAQHTADQLSMGQGWVPESNKKVNEMEDPLIEQMNIIRIYIKEAKLAHKTDEVASLEENLQELKKEFWRKQQCQDDLASRSGESSEAASLSSYDGGNKTASESISSH